MTTIGPYMSFSVEWLANPEDRFRCAAEWLAPVGGVAVLPTAALAHQFGRYLAEKGYVADISVYSYTVWLERQWECFGDGRRLVDVATRKALIAEVLDARLSPESSGRPADVGDLPHGIRFLAQLASAAPEIVNRKDLPNDPVLGILRSYQTLLASLSAIEPAWGERQLVKSLTASWTGNIAWIGFVNPPGWRADLMATMGEHGESRLFGSQFAVLPAGAPEVTGVAPEGRTHSALCAPDTEELTDLRLLQGALISQRLAGEARGDGSVRIVEVQVPSLLAQAVAQRAVDVVTGGCSPDEICILFSKSEVNEKDIVAELSAGGVEVSATGTYRVEQSGLGRAFIAAVRIALTISGGQPDRAGSTVGPLLRSGYSGVDPADAVLADAAARKQKLSTAVLLYQLSTDDEGDALVSRGDRVVFRRLARCAYPGDGKRAVSEGPRRWKLLLDEMLASANSARWDGGPYAGWSASHDRATHLAVTETLASMESAQVPFSAENLLELLLAGEYRVTGAHGATPCVTLAPLSEAVLDRHPHVIIVGAHEGFSQRGADDSAVTAMMARWGLDTKPRSVEASSKLLVAAAGAAKSLTVLYAGGREQGSAEGTFVSSISAALGERVRPERYVPTLESAREQVVAPIRGDRVECDLSRGEDTVEYSPSAIERYHQCPYGWFLQRCLRTDELDGDETVRDIGTAVHSVLREFYSRWQVRSGWSRITDVNLGEAVDLYNQIIGEVADEEAAWLELPLDEWDDLSRMALMAELNGARGRLFSDSRMLRADKGKFLEYEPAHHELQFGRLGNDQVPTMPAATVGGAAIRGAIDRVDVAVDSRGERYAAAIDYKGSVSDVTLQQGLVEGRRIQVLIYALVLRQLIEAQPAAALLASYRGDCETKGAVDWDRAKIKPNSRKDSKHLSFEDVLAETERIVSDCVRGMECGEIAPVIAGEVSEKVARCGYCLFYRCPNRTGGGEDQ